MVSAQDRTSSLNSTSTAFESELRELRDRLRAKERECQTTLADRDAEIATLMCVTCVRTCGASLFVSADRPGGGGLCVDER